MCKDCDEKKKLLLALIAPKMLHGGMFSKINDVSIQGYKDTSPYKHRSSLNINSPNGIITMNGVSKDLIGTDEFGNSQYMKANSGNYQFQGKNIREVPVKQQGGQLSTGNKYIDMAANSKIFGVDKSLPVLAMRLMNKENNLSGEQKGQLIGNTVGAVAGSLINPMSGGQMGSQLGTQLGGAVGGEFDTQMQPQMTTFNTTGIPKAKQGLKLNNMDYRNQLKQYAMGGQVKKSYQEGGMVSGMGALPHSQGGVPAVTPDGQQVAEIEGNERIDSVEDTATQEQIIAQIDATQDPAQQQQLFMQLGQFVYEMTKTQDQVNPPQGMPQEPMMKQGGKIDSFYNNYMNTWGEENGYVEPFYRN